VYAVKKEKGTAYCWINVIVVCITALFFVLNYRSVNRLFEKGNVLSILLLLIAVVIVHIIKAGRLYFALYGNDIGLKSYLETYCKVTPVSIMVPFKIGEFFRIYCFGTEIGNFLKGIVIVLLDRFMDTAALLVVVFGTWAFNGGRINLLTMVFMLFLVAVVMVYFIFPGFYSFWKKYLLHADASERKLCVLKLLENLQILYKEIEQVIKGRGVIMFGISLVAWAVEIGSVLLINYMYSQNDGYSVLMEYLMSAMLNGSSEGLKRFICVSVLLLSIGYLIVRFCIKQTEKRSK